MKLHICLILIFGKILTLLPPLAKTRPAMWSDCEPDIVKDMVYDMV